MKLCQIDKYKVIPNQSSNFMIVTVYFIYVCIYLFNNFAVNVSAASNKLSSEPLRRACRV